MGLFQHKQPVQPQDDSAELEARFLDENFREELRNHGRLYFEKVINENGTLFKEDLDATVAETKTELKAHITAQLDEAVGELKADLKDHILEQLDTQFAEYTKAAKTAQDQALTSIKESATTLQKQHQELSETLRAGVADQKAMMSAVFEENKTQMNTMKDSQASALEWLSQSVHALHEQHQKLAETLQQHVAEQENILVNVFEQNMAQVIEHYLLGALGDQYDLKAQLPSIIKQMEANKQAIVEDMKL